MRRWSKLQKELYLIIDPNIDFQIHCSVYRMQSRMGSTDLPRYWITLNKEIIFDYPCQFVNAEGEINNPDACVGVVVLIRWSQSALIPFVTTQSVGVLKPPHE